MQITLIIQTQYAMQKINCIVANSFISRLRGLLFLKPLDKNYNYQGLLLRHCNTIHTIGMSYAIDIIYLDKKYKIIKCVHKIQPWRLSCCLQAKHTLELAKGEICRLQLCLGQKIKFLVPEKPSYLQNYQTGQAALEMILCLSLLCFVALSTLQIGHFIYAQSHIDHAVFVATREASIAKMPINEILTVYQKALGALSNSQLRLEIINFKDEGEILIQNESTLPSLTIRVTQGYKVLLPIVGILLRKAFANSKTTEEFPDQQFMQRLLRKKQIPLHSKVTLPLPKYIPQYSEQIILWPSLENFQLKMMSRKKANADEIVRRHDRRSAVLLKKTPF